MNLNTFLKLLSNIYSFATSVFDPILGLDTASSYAVG